MKKMKQQRHLLAGKVAIIYGASGAVGRTIARAFAREGAKVFLSGLRLAEVTLVAQEISSAGGNAEAAEVDALDEAAVETYVQGIFEKTGQIDISFNAIGIPQEGIQGIWLTELPVERSPSPL
jgi:NAD(P)-dependent dehydrogenase (short-subunit alcohol dehydrogenase family)